jgi:tetratricopeptide (TPR) repeat protein
VGALVAALRDLADEDLARFEGELALAVSAAGFDPRLLWARHPRKVVAVAALVLLLAGSAAWGYRAYESHQRSLQVKLDEEQRDDARRKSYQLRFDRAVELVEKGQFRDAIAAFDNLVDEATLPFLVEPALAHIARCHGALEDYGAEYTAWLRLLRDYPDAAAYGEANERVLRIAALALKRYGDLQDISTRQDILVDGQKADWTGIEPILVDPQGDNQMGGKASDLVAFYVAVKEGTMYLRFDTAIAPHEGDQYCVAIDLNAFAYDDSTEEWDYQIGVAKGIAPWLWDLRGNRSYDNTKSTRLHGVTFAQGQCVEVSIPLSALGNPTSLGIRAFLNYAGMKQPNDVVARKVLLRWAKAEPDGAPLVPPATTLGQNQ